MKYAVLYISRTGNTRKLAELLYSRLPSADTVMLEIGRPGTIPDADLYFIGFPIHDQFFGVEIMDLLEKLEHKEVAIFASCGIPVTEERQRKMKNQLSVWLSDTSELKALFMCQCRSTPVFEQWMYIHYPDANEQIKQLCEDAMLHPNDEDLKRLDKFIMQILYEHS